MPVTLTWLGTETRTLMAGGDETEVTYEQVILDGTASETYDGESTATEHPVEDGADITDHVRPGLKRCSGASRNRRRGWSPWLAAYSSATWQGRPGIGGAHSPQSLPAPESRARGLSCQRYDADPVAPGS